MTSECTEYRAMLRRFDSQQEAKARQRAEQRAERLERERVERIGRRRAEREAQAKAEAEAATSGAWSFWAPPADAVPPPGTVDRTERPPWGDLTQAPGLTPADRAALRQAGIVPPAQSTNIRGA